MSERFVELFKSHDGSTVARVDGRSIYSRYDPGHEAERFIRTKLSGRLPDSDAPLLIVSDGLGHLERSARTLFPARRILSIHLHAELSRVGAADADAVCVVGDKCDPGRFVAEHVEAEEVDSLDVVEWPPALRAFPESYRNVSERITGALRRLIADAATVSRWGRLWIRNILRNADRLRFRSSLPSFAGRTVLVVCPGPTLAALIPHLHALPRLPVVVAVASAAITLRAWGIPPDLVVHSDAGFYSTYHFTGDFATELCMPLTAAPPPRAKSVETRHCFRVFSGNSHVEAVALAGIAAVPVIPEAGSVSATAVRISCAVSEGPCYVSGLDLAADDLLVHARPHAFDGYLASRASRFSPEHHLRFERTADMTRGPGRERHAGNMSTYASWFRDNRASFERVSRLAPTSVDTGLRAATVDELAGAVSLDNASGSEAAGDGEDKRKTKRNLKRGGSGAELRLESSRIVERWRSGLVAGGNVTELARELARWLGCDVVPGIIDKELRSIRRTDADARR